MDLSSVPDRESLARVLRLFQLVHECDRKVFGGYVALTVSSNQKFVFTESEFVGFRLDMCCTKSVADSKSLRG
jgi:hypothetical protein